MDLKKEVQATKERLLEVFEDTMDNAEIFVEETKPEVMDSVAGIGAVVAVAVAAVSGCIGFAIGKRVSKKKLIEEFNFGMSVGAALASGADKLKK